MTPPLAVRLVPIQPLSSPSIDEVVTSTCRQHCQKVVLFYHWLPAVLPKALPCPAQLQLSAPPVAETELCMCGKGTYVVCAALCCAVVHRSRWRQARLHACCGQRAFHCAKVSVETSSAPSRLGSWNAGTATHRHIDTLQWPMAYTLCTCHLSEHMQCYRIL